MHAKGSDAFGKFTVTNHITKYTRARIFSNVGKVTEGFVRFSLVTGERGAADTERDIRGLMINFDSNKILQEVRRAVNDGFHFNLLYSVINNSSRGGLK